MSSPNKLANLTFSYASTSSAFKKGLGNQRREFLDDKSNNKTLASTSRIFSTDKIDQAKEAERSESFRKVENSYREKLEKSLQARLEKKESFKEADEDHSINTNSLDASLDFSLDERDHFVYEEDELRDSSFSKSEEDIETNIELDYQSSVQRSISFSVPRDSHLRQDGPSVAKVTRSNSRRLIEDDNNLKSLFQRARSNENLNDPELYIDSDSREQSSESLHHTRTRTRSIEEINENRSNPTSSIYRSESIKTEEAYKKNLDEKNGFRSTSSIYRSESMKTDQQYEKNFDNQNRSNSKSSIYRSESIKTGDIYEKDIGDKNRFHTTSSIYRSESMKTEENYDNNFNNQNRYHSKSSIKIDDDSSYDNRSRYNDHVDSKPSVNRTESIKTETSRIYSNDSSTREQSRNLFQYDNTKSKMPSQFDARHARNEYGKDNANQVTVTNDMVDQEYAR